MKRFEDTCFLEFSILLSVCSKEAPSSPEFSRYKSPQLRSSLRIMSQAITTFSLGQISRCRQSVQFLYSIRSQPWSMIYHSLSDHKRTDNSGILARRYLTPICLSNYTPVTSRNTNCQQAHTSHFVHQPYIHRATKSCNRKRMACLCHQQGFKSLQSLHSIRSN